MTKKILKETITKLLEEENLKALLNCELDNESDNILINKRSIELLYAEITALKREIKNLKRK